MATARTKSLFSFGTLMDRDVLEIVSGQSSSELNVVAARAVGFAQRAVVNQSFPVLVSDKNDSVTGVIVDGLTDVALERILFFEGDEYVLADIDVTTADGATVGCQYFRDTAVYEIAEADWDFQGWQQCDKAHFVVRSTKFMTLFGTMSATEADAFW